MLSITFHNYTAVPVGQELNFDPRCLAKIDPFKNELFIRIIELYYFLS